MHILQIFIKNNIKFHYCDFRASTLGNIYNKFIRFCNSNFNFAISSSSDFFPFLFKTKTFSRGYSVQI